MFPAGLIPSPWAAFERRCYDEDISRAVAHARFHEWESLKADCSLVLGTYKHQIGLWKRNPGRGANPRPSREYPKISTLDDEFILLHVGNEKHGYPTLEDAIYGLLAIAPKFGGEEERCRMAAKDIKARCDGLRSGLASGRLFFKQGRIHERIRSIDGLLKVSRAVGATCLHSTANEKEARFVVEHFGLVIEPMWGERSYVFTRSKTGRTWKVSRPGARGNFLRSHQLEHLYLRLLAVLAKTPETQDALSGHRKLLLREFVHGEVFRPPSFDAVHPKWLEELIDQ